jgi:hypothetical protein
LEAKKLSIRERELRLEELRTAQQQLEKLECTREDEVDPEVWTIESSLEGVNRLI